MKYVYVRFTSLVLVMLDLLVYNGSGRVRKVMQEGLSLLTSSAEAAQDEKGKKKKG